MTFMKIIQNLFVKLEIILYYDVEFVASSNKPHNWPNPPPTTQL